MLWWGSELTTLYNDGYLPMLGNKHPASLGRPCREVWAEIWPTIGPMLEGVMDRGEATWSDDLPLLFDRRGFPEEGYFTFSYSPIRDPDGTVGGIFCAVNETTGRVRSERRLALLRDLALKSHLDPQSAAEDAVATLARANQDITFAAIALHGEDGAETLGETIITGPARVSESTREELRAAGARVAASRQRESLRLRGDPMLRAEVLPLLNPGAGMPDILTLGRNPVIPDDDDYRTFFDLVATHIANELAAARAHDAERRRADALAELDRAKTVFFTNVSHEFRTPLTLIDAPLREVVDDPALPDEHRERIELARRASGRLRRLVNTLLEFSRIEAGTSRPAMQRVNLVEALHEVTSVFRSAFERAGLDLDVVDDGTAASVRADPEMVERILLNLVSNALKFTQDGGVRLIARSSGQTAIVEVVDTGIGIARDDLERVFDRFARFDPSWARSREGSGIGLALASELARIQDGSLDVESRLGEGTTFRLTLPLAAGATSPRHAARSESPPGKVDRAAFADEASGWLHRPGERGVGASLRPADGSIRSRILVVDDNADMNTYLGRVLGRHWTVELESDGWRALERIIQNPPDLVLADVMMPGIDGLELVRRIRHDARLTTLPVMLLSARAGDEATSEGLAAGADEYLLKPFTASDLVVRVASRLERDQARRAEEATLTANQAELRELVERLQENEQDLMTALQVKDDFLGMVSHELRTPITTIRGNAELLLSRANTLDPTLLRGAMDDIATEAERLNRVIENLLLLARVGNGHLDAEPVLVGRVVDRVVSAALRDQPNRVVEVSVPTDLLTTANDGAIEQILKNLVSNALKYSDPAEPVAIEGRSANGRLELSVTDGGLGLSPEDTERIFEPFYRAERTQKIAGVGIGLTVARRLAEAVGGALRAEARPRGARFTLTLPELQVDEDDDDPALVAGMI